MLNDKRIRLIIGHYGSGKTEFSINYAIKLAAKNKKVAISDLDLVNLYFRSREKTEFLEDLGIRVIASSIKASAVDIPAVSPEIAAPLQDKSYEAIIDVGGDPAGARALVRYNHLIVNDEYDMFFIVNRNRPETQTCNKVIEYIRNIEDTARLKVTGLVNNTHMLKASKVEDILYGQELVEEVSKETGIPIKYISAIEKVAKGLPNNLKGKVFPINLYMRQDWML